MRVATADGAAELPGLRVPGPSRLARNAPTAARPRTPADTLPVARVALDVSLAHLDRQFDYLVPAELDEAAVVGCRIRVRFAGRLVDGYLLDRVDVSEHQGTLAYLDKVISSEPVLTAEVARLARAVADRYAGTLADVLRLAVPPRHARAEAAAVEAAAVEAAAAETPQPRPLQPRVLRQKEQSKGRSVTDGAARERGSRTRAARSSWPPSPPCDPDLEVTSRAPGTRPDP